MSNDASKPFRQLLLITCLLCLLLGGLSLALGMFRGGLEKQLLLSVATTTGEGLHAGMRVTYKGFKLGSVQSVELLPTDQVSCIVAIDQKYAHLFTKGTWLKISQGKLVNNDLVLQRQDAEAQPLTSLATIDLRRDDLATDVMRRAEPLLEGLNKLLTQLTDPNHGIQPTLAKSQSTMEDTRVILRDTHRLLASLSNPDTGFPAMIQQFTNSKTGFPSVVNQTRLTLEQLTPVTKQSERVLLELEKNLQTTQTVMVQTQSLLQRLNEPKGGLPIAVDKASALIDKIDHEVQNLQKAGIYRFLVPNRDAHKPNTQSP
jgi:ABC-type transporter Mla subunit MlaD